MIRQYGCIRGPQKYSFTYRAINPMPVALFNVDLRKQKSPDVLNQPGSSCTGHGTYWAIGYAYLNDKKSVAVTPSPLFLYYNGRKYENTTSEDCGAVIDDVVTGATTFGICDISLWPDSQELLLKQPPADVYLAASKTKALKVQTVDNSRKENILQCLYDGFPVVFGMDVPPAMASENVAETGILDDTSGTNLGGHCMCIVGYNKLTDMFIVANSWGTSWGQDGYMKIPAAYLTSGHAHDFHTINTVQ